MRIDDDFEDDYSYYVSKNVVCLLINVRPFAFLFLFCCFDFSSILKI